MRTWPMSRAGLMLRPQSNRMSLRSTRCSPVSMSSSTSVQAAPKVQYASGSAPLAPAPSSPSGYVVCEWLHVMLRTFLQHSQQRHPWDI